MKVSRYLSLYGLFLLAAAATLLLVQMTGFADDPGVGWHLASGRWMLSSESVPRFDPFLAWPVPRPWISDQWLSDLALYALYAAGSWALLCTALTVFFLGAFMGIAYRTAREYSGSALAAAPAAFIAFKLGLIHFTLRPVLFSFVFFAAVLWIVLRFYRRADQSFRAPIGETALCVILFLLWCNFHPSFVIGLALPALLVMALIIDKFFFDRNVPSATVHWALLMALGAALLTVINPYGLALHRSIFTLWHSAYFTGLHQEWRSLDFRNIEGNTLELALLLVIIGTYAGRGERRAATFEILTTLLFLHLSLAHARFLPYLGLILAPLTARSLAALPVPSFLQNSAAGSRLSRVLYRWEAAEAAYPRTGILAAVSAALIASALIFGRLPGGPGELGPRREVYPYPALQALKTSLPDGKPCVVFSHPNWGGFITWNTREACRPLIDDRNTLAGESFHREYMQHLSASSGLQPWLNNTGASFAILPPDSPAAKALASDAGWREVYRDEKAVLWRANPPSPGLMPVLRGIVPRQGM